MVDKPTPGVPVYVVKSIAGGRPRVLHRNLLLSLQGRIRQEDVTREENSPDSESEGETHEPTRAPCEKPRGTSHVNSTKRRGAPVHLSGGGQPTLRSSPEHVPEDEDSSEDEEYSTSSVLTARGPTPVDNSPTTAETVDGQSVTPELVSNISSIAQPLLPDQTLDSVNIEHEQEPESDEESETDSDSDSKRPVPTALRRSARSTKGIPPVHYGQVQIHSTIISDLEKPTRYRQVLYVPLLSINRDR